MEFIEWLCLLAMAAVGCFFNVFMFWRAITLMRKRRRGAMSRGRIVWLLLGGLSIIAVFSFVMFAAWQSIRGWPEVVGISVWIAWGVAEIAIALRAAFRLRRPA
jgi:hypothetical protein